MDDESIIRWGIGPPQPRRSNTMIFQKYSDQKVAEFEAANPGKEPPYMFQHDLFEEWKQLRDRCFDALPYELLVN